MFLSELLQNENLVPQPSFPNRRRFGGGSSALGLWKLKCWKFLTFSIRWIYLKEGEEGNVGYILSRSRSSKDDISFASSSSNFDMIKKPSSSSYLLIYGGTESRSHGLRQRVVLFSVKVGKLIQTSVKAKAVVVGELRRLHGREVPSTGKEETFWNSDFRDLWQNECPYGRQSNMKLSFCFLKVCRHMRDFHKV